MAKNVFLEVCCASVEDAMEAQHGGAQRVELNSSMFFGGLTPSPGSIMQAKKRLDIPVIVMIRPRGGGFCYTEVEYDIMRQDTRSALQYGADGIIFGILQPDGTIDVRRSRTIVEMARQAGKEIVFHRAFDVTPDPFEALEQLIEMGVHRLLTSGQEASVPEGIPLIKKLIEKAGDRMEIMPGGGIKPSNLALVIEQTGAKTIHIAAFKTKIDPSCQHRPRVTFGGCLYPPENQYDLIDRDAIRTVSEICSST
ncbi:MAG: copper homeostasis protein CutC [Sedimentisphaerales bacterium]|nr:copper homeostasis protein CutC [Sedimentisphaerales bacterium]